MNEYPVGTKLLHIESGLKGVVVENFKLPGDVCVRWETGFETSYDASFLNEICEVLEC